MHSKQMLASCFALLFLVLILSSGTALASRTLSVGDDSGSAGETVQVPIFLDDPSNIAAVAFTLNYDKDVLTFLGIEEANPLPLRHGSAYQVPEDEVVNGTAYYNPYQKAAPYANAEYETVSNSTLFFQVNSDPAHGKVLLAAASAVPHTSKTLCYAAFSIQEATGFQGKSVLNIAPSIIHNLSAGYANPTKLPVLTGLPAQQPNDQGYFPTATYETTFESGLISVTPKTYTISGQAYYGPSTSSPAASTHLSLFKKDSLGRFSLLLETTQVNHLGSYSFGNLPPGAYKLHGEPGNPNYFSNNWFFNLNATDMKQTLHFEQRDVQVKGSVGNSFPGLKVQIRGLDGHIYQEVPVNDGTFFAGYLPEGSHVYLIYGSAEQQLENFQSGQNWNWEQTLSTLSGTITGLQQDAKVLVSADSQTANLEISNFSSAATDTGNATYAIQHLLPAADYIVSGTGSGLPVVYSENATAYAEADRIDLSSGNATADIHFPVPKASLSGTAMLNESPLPAKTPIYAYELNTQAYVFTMTDDSGEFSFNLIPGTYVLSVLYDTTAYYHQSGQATQSLAQAKRLVLTSGASFLDKDISIVLCNETLSGLVEFDTGEPAAALISAWSQNRSSQAVATTDAQGHYTLQGLCNATQYTVQMDVFDNTFPVQTKTITAGEDSILDFSIKTLNMLSGAITDDEDGSPVSRAMIYLSGTAGTLVGEKVYYSKQDGSYTIQGVPNGIYTLKVYHPDYMGAALNLSIDGNAEQNVQLVKGAWFQGTVTSSKELPGTLIMASNGSQPAYALTNPQGKYEIHGLQTQSYLLKAQKSGFLSQVKTANATKTGLPKVDFTLSPPLQVFNLKGTVQLEDNATVNNAQVVIDSKSQKVVRITKTGANGQYFLRNLPKASDYRFVVVPVGDLQIAVEDPLTVEDGSIDAGQTEVNNITLESGSSISGTLTWAGGASGYVFLYNSQQKLLDYTRAAEDGSYAFKGLSAGTSYKLYAVAPGNDPEWYSGKTSLSTADAVSAGSNNIHIDLTDE